MSIASRASAQINELAATMENNMVQMQAMMTLQTTTLQTNIAAMMAAAPLRRAPRSRTAPAAVDGVVQESPAAAKKRVAFFLIHDKVITGTDHISPLIPALTIEELWWLQQHVDDAKIKYDMKGTTFTNYKEDVWKYRAKQTAGMTVKTNAAART